jgi:serine-type D-Ala-D-Ala carboxypeptidase/endopeptidase (penicillin-binding protein 4)
MRIKNLFIVCLLAFTAIISSCSVNKKATGDRKGIIDSAANTLINSNELSTAHVGIAVYNPAENKYLYNYQSEKYFIPASNTKIITCYTVMKYLGDSLIGLRVDDCQNASLLHPTGDPTLLNPDFNTNPVIDFLKAQTSKLIFLKGKWDETALGAGWAWDDYQDYYSMERSALPVYGNVVTAYGNNTHLTIQPTAFTNSFSNLCTDSTLFVSHVKRALNTNEFVADKYSKEESNTATPFIVSDSLVLQILADTIHKKIYTLSDGWHAFPPIVASYKIHSQPTDSLLKIMMHRSDNFYAEQSLLMVSDERLNVMNDEKIIDTLLKTDFKSMPQKPRWVDGSGLSRYNNFTPQDFVFVLDKMRKEFSWNRITTIFPTGGSGTDLTGKIYAKSGSMSNITCLSGYIITNKGKTLIFSVLVNNHMTTATIVRKKIDTFLSAVISNY